MKGFEWAEHHLGASDPHKLQEQGVNIYFAPNISPARKVVDLATGRIDVFPAGQERPEVGFFADMETLGRYCLAHGLPLDERDGQAVLQSSDPHRAGDPLHHTES